MPIGALCLREVGENYAFIGVARALVESMLEFNPARRITAGEILLHPWIRVSIKTLMISGRRVVGK
jgi:hypothetical protein